MAMETAKTPVESLADIAASASPEQAAALLRDIWRAHVLKFAEGGVSADALAKSLLDMGVRVGMDTWGPSATAAALTETAELIRDLPELNSPAGKH